MFSLMIYINANNTNRMNKDWREKTKSYCHLVVSDKSVVVGDTDTHRALAKLSGVNHWC